MVEASAMRRGLTTLLLVVGVGSAIVALAVVGCTTKPPTKALTRYQALPAKKVPGFMKDTIYELCEMTRTEGLAVSGFGVVTNLDGTGDSKAPTAVRQYIVKEMLKHKVGSSLIPGARQMTPERMLTDPRVAIVEVLGLLPPGARKG